MSNQKNSYSFPLKKVTKIDMQKQRAMIKIILKLKSGNIVVGSYGAVLTIWDPKTKNLIQGLRANGMVNDLIELDNEDLITCCSGSGPASISIFRFDNKVQLKYVKISDIKSDDFLLSAMVKLDKDKFLYGSMDNNVVFIAKDEANNTYKEEKKIKLESKDEDDCIYCIIKISNGNFISTGLSYVKLINSESFKLIKDIYFSQPSCLYEDSKKNIWVGNSPGSILILDSELNKIKELENIHKLQINKFVEFDNHIISASTDFKMKVWDINTYECLDTIEGYGEITAISLINENCLVTAQGIPQTDDMEYYDEEDLLQFLVYYEK